MQISEDEKDISSENVPALDSTIIIGEMDEGSIFEGIKIGEESEIEPKEEKI